MLGFIAPLRRSPLPSPISVSPPMTFFASIDSTNSELARRYPDLLPWSTIVADHQTRGRGRHGRSWVDVGDTGTATALLLSVAVPVAETELSWLTPLAGLAVARCLRELMGAVHRQGGPSPARVAIKWPNDVLVNERKVAGILCEHLGVDRTGDHLVAVGIGVNLTAHPAYLPRGDAAVPATDLSPWVSGEDVGRRRDELAVQMVGELRQVLVEIRRRGLAPMREHYRALLHGKGQSVIFQRPAQRPARGRLVDVDSRGRLVVRTEAGCVQLSDGTISVVARQDQSATPRRRTTRDTQEVS